MSAGVSPASRPLHILVLTERDWTHPRGGGTGADLHGQVDRWLESGHRVTVIAGAYRGARAEESPRPGLTLHRMGAVLPRAAWALRRRGIGRDADVVLEVVDGIPFFTPLWLRRPRVALVHQRSPANAPRRALAGFLLETLPLRFLYRATPFVATSPAARDGLVALGVPNEQIQVASALDVLQAEAVADRESLRAALMASETAKAAGLAVATMGANVVSLLFTLVFARVLGTKGYGSLAALVSTFLILSVPGLALQVAAARETALGRLGTGSRLSATHRRWMVQLAWAFAALALLGVLLRRPLANLIGVEDVWGAAGTLATGCAWLALSLERGLLQGMREYWLAGTSTILEAVGRLVLGLALVGLGAGVSGAYLASPLSMVAMAVALAVVLRRRLGEPHPTARTRSVDSLIAGAWAPVLGLTLVAVLQNVDVIIVKHRVGGDGAGAYAAAAVAAKVVIWVGIGLAYYLVPEAARRAQAGLNPRGVLARAVAIVLAVAAPMLLVYGVAPGFVLRAGFDVHFAPANHALVVLGAAMTLLAVASLAVQYMLAIERYTFMFVLGIVAALEPLLLSNAGRGLVGLATLVLGLQFLAASAMLALSLRVRRAAAAAPS